MTHVVHQPNEGGDWIRSKVFDRRAATEAPVASGSGQSAIQFKDEGSALGAAGTVDEVDFVGAGVSSARVSNKVTVTIAGGSGSGQWTFVERVTRGSAGTDLASTVAWDLTANEQYKLVINVKNNGAAEYPKLYFNGDTTATNYYRQFFSGGVYYAANDALIGYADGAMTADVIISRDQNGYPRSMATEVSGAVTAPVAYSCVHTRNNTANVTSMKLYLVNSFTTGSYVDIYVMT